MWGPTRSRTALLEAREFQSTAPVWGPTTRSQTVLWLPRHFNPRPPCGGRPNQTASRPAGRKFQSTAPVWGPTRQGTSGSAWSRFQSTAPVWGPTLTTASWGWSATISIHGPRVGADPRKRPACPAGWNFNPRPPCGGRRKPMPGRREDKIFQSTAPVWGPTALSLSNAESAAISIHGPRVGADLPLLLRATGGQDFNPRPPCGGRLASGGPVPVKIGISIHGPRVGADRSRVDYLYNVLQFQSTAPVWGPTCGIFCIGHRCSISIHGPRVGADLTFGYSQPSFIISIHGPRVGADGARAADTSSWRYFNPRPPCGGRRPLGR